MEKLIALGFLYGFIMLYSGIYFSREWGRHIFKLARVKCRGHRQQSKGHHAPHKCKILTLTLWALHGNDEVCQWCLLGTAILLLIL